MIKDPLVFILHIIESINNIELFTRGVSFDYFLKNKEKQNAVIREIEIIGEAVKNVSSTFRKKYHDIPWKDIAGMRDKLMHHYFGVNLNTVWKVTKDDLPELKKKILTIKQELSKK